MAQTPKRIYENLCVDEQVTSAELCCEYTSTPLIHPRVGNRYHLNWGNLFWLIAEIAALFSKYSSTNRFIPVLA